MYEGEINQINMGLKILSIVFIGELYLTLLWILNLQIP